VKKAGNVANRDGDEIEKSISNHDAMPIWLASIIA